MVVFLRRDWITSPVACDSTLQPSNFDISSIVVDFPDHGYNKKTFKNSLI
jgi:hypothetical protein